MSNKTFVGLLAKFYIAKNNFFGDVFITFVSIVITAGISLFTQGVAARVLTAAGFGEYLTVVRISNVLLPIVMLGMPVALVRYLGLLAARSEQIRVRFVLITTVITSFSFGLLLVLLVVTPLPWIEIVLGASAKLRFAIAWLLAGLIPYTLAYAFYRGSFLMLPAAILSILESAVFLFVFLVDPSESPLAIIILIGQIIMVLSLIFLAVGIFQKILSRPILVVPANEDQVSSSYLMITKDVLRYGLPRVPGFLILGLLFSTGTFILARMGDMAGSASLNVGINVLSLASFITGPIGIVLLPRGSSMVGQGKKADLAILSKDILFSGIHLGGFMFFQWLVLGPFLLEIWLKFTAFELVAPVMIICLSLPFFITYDILRNILDSLTHHPINLINQILSLAVFGVIFPLASWFGLGLSISAAIGMAGSLIVLGLLTGYRLIKEFGIHISRADAWVGLKSFLAVLVISLITGGALKLMVPLPIIVRFGLIGLVTSVLGLVYLAYLYFMQASWLMRIADQAAIQRIFRWIASRMAVNKI